jgi:hypothetical protein
MSVVKGSVPIPQARHYLLDQGGHSVGRHASNPLITACRLPFYIKTRKLATEVSLADDTIQTEVSQCVHHVLLLSPQKMAGLGALQKYGRAHTRKNREVVKNQQPQVQNANLGHPALKAD